MRLHSKKEMLNRSTEANFARRAAFLTRMLPPLGHHGGRAVSPQSYVENVRGPFEKYFSKNRGVYRLKHISFFFRVVCSFYYFHWNFLHAHEFYVTSFDKNLLLCHNGRIWESQIKNVPQNFDSELLYLPCRSYKRSSESISRLLN